MTQTIINVHLFTIGIVFAPVDQWLFCFHDDNNYELIPGQILQKYYLLTWYGGISSSIMCYSYIMSKVFVPLNRTCPDGAFPKDALQRCFSSEIICGSLNCLCVVCLILSVCLQYAWCQRNILKHQELFRYFFCNITLYKKSIVLNLFCFYL